MLQIWYIMDPLFVQIFAKKYLRLCAMIVARLEFFDVLPTCFYMFWDITLKVAKYSQWMGRHTEFKLCCNRDTLAYFTATMIGSFWHSLQREEGQSHFSTFMAHEFRCSLQILHMHWYGLCPSQYWFSSELCNLGNSSGEINGVTQPKFSRLFLCLEISIYKSVYSLSRLHNILSSCFTRPISCS